MDLLQPYFQYLVPLIEITCISFVLYFLITSFWNTRTMDLMLGMLVFLLLFVIATWMNFPVLQKLMQYFVSVAVIAILVIFQPEIRIGLSKLSVKGKKAAALSEFDKFLESLALSIYRMSEKRVGAIVLLENQDSLDEYAAKSVILNAQFSSELLEAIFGSSSPLHDGAVIIRNATIVAASVILPLADESQQLSRSMGTRHRAALGITQQRDALSIVVSEETGKVSIARDGIMTRGIKIDRFMGILRSIFNPLPAEGTRVQSKKNWFSFRKGDA